MFLRSFDFFYIQFNNSRNYLKYGVVHIDQVANFMIFLKCTSRLLSDRCVELKISGCRCHFRVFQIELDTLGTKNFGIGSVVEKLQLFEVGWIIGKARTVFCC